jgi:hypothetical protein
MATTCGSTAGHLRHLWLQEESCPDCATAWVKFADTAPVARRGHTTQRVRYQPRTTFLRRRP